MKLKESLVQALQLPLLFVGLHNVHIHSETPRGLVSMRLERLQGTLSQFLNVCRWSLARETCTADKENTPKKYIKEFYIHLRTHLEPGKLFYVNLMRNTSRDPESLRLIKVPTISMPCLALRHNFFWILGLGHSLKHTLPKRHWAVPISRAIPAFVAKNAAVLVSRSDRFLNRCPISKAARKRQVHYRAFQCNEKY